jgi:hypothetical protein
MTAFQLHTFETIDNEKWNHLVLQSEKYVLYASIDYLKLSCKSCYFLVDENYESGIFLPFKRVLGVEIIYTPATIPFSRFIGKNHLTFEQVKYYLPKSKQWHFLFLGKQTTKDSIGKVFQTKDFNKKYSQQATRKIKHAQKNSLQVKDISLLNIDVNFLESELSKKNKTFNSSYFSTFKNICTFFQKSGKLLVLQVCIEEKVLCILYFAKSNGWMYYLKGVANEMGYSMGSMYLGMSEALAQAEKNNLKFDFGGSSIQGIRQFFHSFGANDEDYSEIHVFEGPSWFILAKKIQVLLKCS